jgi:hypothetical protein
VASYIVVEVGGTSTFVTYDVTKVEVRWAESHLKLKSHAPKECGRLTPWNSAGLSCPRPAWALAGPGLALLGQGRATAGFALPGQGRASPPGPGLPCRPMAGPGRGHAGRGRGLALAMAMALVMAVVPKFLHSQFLMYFQFSIGFAL